MKKLTKLVALVLTMSIFFNMTAFAADTSVVTVKEEEVEPESRINIRQYYQSTPYHGTSSEYTELVSDIKTNDKLGALAAELTVKAIAKGLAKYFHIESDALDTAADIINACLGLKDTIYVRTTTYGHKDDTWSYRKIITRTYSDSSYTKCISTKTEYMRQIFF